MRLQLAMGLLAAATLAPLPALAQIQLATPSAADSRAAQPTFAGLYRSSTTPCPSGGAPAASSLPAASSSRPSGAAGSAESETFGAAGEQQRIGMTPARSLTETGSAGSAGRQGVSGTNGSTGAPSNPAVSASACSRGTTSQAASPAKPVLTPAERERRRRQQDALQAVYAAEPLKTAAPVTPYQSPDQDKPLASILASSGYGAGGVTGYGANAVSGYGSAGVSGYGGRGVSGYPGQGAAALSGYSTGPAKAVASDGYQ